MKCSRWIIIGLLVVTAAGAALRAWPIASRPLWFDEASDTLTSARSQGVTYADMFLWRADFQAAPFTFLIRRATMDLLGTEAAWAQRLPAVLCAIACIPMAFWLGRVVRSNVVGLLAATLVAFDPNMVDMGQQSRSYPMLMLLTLGAMIVAIKALRAGSEPSPLGGEGVRPSPLGGEGGPALPGRVRGGPAATGVAIDRQRMTEALPSPQPSPQRGEGAGPLPRPSSQSGKGAGWLSWLVLGVLLGLAFCTTQFALALWVGLGLAAAALLIGGHVTGRPNPHASRIVVGFVVTYLVAAAIASVGLVKLLTRDTGRNWGADKTYPEIAREIIVAAKDLIGLTPAGLVVYLFAAVGLFLLYRKCRTSAAVLVCVGLAMVLLLFPFRKTHHFMAPRYVSLIQPALWIGLAMLADAFIQWPLRLAGATVVAVVIAAGLGHSIDQESWFTGPDRGKWLTTPQILDLRDHLVKPGEAVVYQPQTLEKVGRVYRLPIDPLLDEGFYLNYRDRDKPRVPDTFTAPGTWLVIGMVSDPSRLAKAHNVAEALAKHYQAPIDPALWARHVREGRTVLAHFTEGRVEWRSIGGHESMPLISAAN